MSDNDPADADGAAIRRVAARGTDLSRPIDVDFVVDVPSRAAGERIKALAGRLGYETILEADEDEITWTCFCSQRMLLTYDALIAARSALDAVCRPHGGSVDGWGTSGQATEG